MRLSISHLTKRRRGAVAVLVAVAMTTMLGFAALTIDVGMVYNARADLQRTADSAALAAAGALSGSNTGNPLQEARYRAIEFAGMNTVLGKSIVLDPATDIVMGRAVYDYATTSYTFTPTDFLPDAVRIRTRLTEDSPNGALPLFFAGVLGRTSTNVSAEAIAALVARDIAVVADLSGSHNDDSELRNYKVTDINLFAVWDALPGGADEIDGGLWDLGQIPPSWYAPDGTIPPAAGPAWGYFRETGWGTETIDAGYNPTGDNGLTRLAYRQNWNDAQLTTFLTDKGYIPSEVNAIMSQSYDTKSGVYQNRIAIALGVAVWNSGHPGGLWEQAGFPPSPSGNGNNWIGNTETTWVENVFGNTLGESESIWRGYANYMKSGWTRMSQANANFRYRYGPKTFVNYLLERRPKNSDTPELSQVPTQPMQAVKDATSHLSELLFTLESNDQISLEVYGTIARHEVDLTNNFMEVGNRLNEMQASHYDGFTNMGGGIKRAVEELTSVRARSGARKMIILLTDGNANVSESGSAGTSDNAVALGATYALAQAQVAKDAGIHIFAVSVGAGANLDLMQQIADIANGEHFYASGTIEEYSAKLDEIFWTIGGQRLVQLIQ